MFGSEGVWQGTLLLFDRETHSEWLQLTGECVSGSLKGRQLAMIAGRHATWREWKRDHPDTEVLANQDPEKYYPRSQTSKGSWAFPPDVGGSIQDRHNRLDGHALVMGIGIDEESVAYPVDEFPDDQLSLINDVVGGTPVMIGIEPGSRSLFAYERTVRGNILQFHVRGGRIIERETNSVFDAAGRCISGPLAGEKLDAVGMQAEWYGWYASHLRTMIWSGKHAKAVKP